VAACCTRALFFGEEVDQPGFEAGDGAVVLCAACAGTCAGFRASGASGVPAPVRPRGAASPFECGCASLGACLFESRLGEAMGSDATRALLRKRRVEGSPRRQKMRQRIAGYLAGAERQHAPGAIEQARHALPMADLLAAVPPGVMGDADAFAEALLRAVLRWFKKEFFAWVDTLPCPTCGGPTAHAPGGGAPTEEDMRHGARRVEIHACTADACEGAARFPRYNDPVKLLETRRGRCGEWANCFTLIAAALGYDARICYDWTDHVWTEVWLSGPPSGAGLGAVSGRWVHMDSCENAFDRPRMYEKGWGKRLSYVVAVSPDFGAVDVSRRYVLNYADTLTRRTECSEADLHSICVELQEAARHRLVGAHDERRAEEVAQRHRADTASLDADHAGALTGAAAEEGGEQARQSGSLAWRAARGELG